MSLSLAVAVAFAVANEELTAHNTSVNKSSEVEFHSKSSEPELYYKSVS
jgi:hypothetical protein